MPKQHCFLYLLHYNHILTHSNHFRYFWNCINIGFIWSWNRCVVKMFYMAGKSRLLATMREAGKMGSKNSCCFVASVLWFSFVLGIFSTNFTMHCIHLDSHIDFLVLSCVWKFSIIDGISGNMFKTILFFLVPGERIQNLCLTLLNQNLWTIDNKSSSPIYLVNNLRLRALCTNSTFSIQALPAVKKYFLNIFLMNSHMTSVINSFSLIHKLN